MVVDLDDPKVLSTIPLNGARATRVPFRYLFATTATGLEVVQPTSRELNPKFYGFSPAPNPKLIAWRKTQSEALAVSPPPPGARPRRG